MACRAGAFLRSGHDLGVSTFAKNASTNRNSTFPPTSSFLEEPLAELELGKMGSCNYGIWAEMSQDLHLFPLQSATPWGYGKVSGKTVSLHMSIAG